MQEVQNIREQKDTYQLIVKYQNEELQIKLTTKSKIFRSIFSNSSLNSEIIMSLGTTQFVFELLKSPDNYSVNYLNGQITIKTFMEVNDKKFNKSTLLKLDEISMDKTQRVFEELRELKKRVKQMEKEVHRNYQQNIEKTNKIKYLERQNEKVKIILDRQEEKFSQIMKIIIQNEDNEDRRLKDQALGGKLQVLQQKVTHILENQKELQESFFNIGTPYAKQFQINKRVVTYRGKNNKDTQILLQQTLKKDTEHELTCIIRQAKKRLIFLGIVDIRKQLVERSSYISGNAVGYFGDDGRIFYGIKDGEFRDEVQGEGFREGDEVRMKVNLRSGLISWSVHGRERASITVPLLRSSTRQFVPFAQFENTGDSVEWL